MRNRKTIYTNKKHRDNHHIIHSRTTSYRRELDCLVVENITQDIPTNGISRNELQVPKGIVLADPQFNQPSRIDLLLGADVFFDLLCIGRMKLADNQPTWQKTRLGWIVSGGLATMQNLIRSSPVACPSMSS